MSWGALALALTALGGIYTWWALRHRGFTAAVRAAGITLLPIAAWMTGLLSVFGDVVDTFSNWFAHLVFSPKVWLGDDRLRGRLRADRRRERDVAADRPEAGQDASAKGAKAKPKAVRATSAADPLIDDEMAEIQAILKKRGIS